MPEDIQFTDLNSIRIASPCHVAWNQMEQIEGDRIRHCAKCNLHVYDLSAMSRREAMQLVEDHQGQLCVRFYRRKDGTILTRDCPAASERGSVGIISRVVFWFMKKLVSLPLFLSIGTGMGRPTFSRYKARLQVECPPELRDIMLESIERDEDRLRH